MSDQKTNGGRPGVGIVGPVRLSYMQVFKPRKNELRQGVMEYSAVLLIPKMPTAFCPQPKEVGKRARALILEALTHKFGKEPPKWDNPLKDGDTETNNEGEPKNPGYWYISVRCGAEYPPVLIDGSRQAVFDGWQSGDWGNVKVSFYGYEYEGKKGVGSGLRAIQFVKHDDPLGTSNDPAAVAGEFDEVEGDAPLPSSTATPEGEYDPFADS